MAVEYGNGVNMGSVFDIKLIPEYLVKLIPAIPTTLLILVSALFCGTIIALFVALVRLYKIPVLNQLALVYVSFIRGVPTLIQLFLVFYGIPSVLLLLNIDISRAPALIFVIVTYSLGMGSFLSEIIRTAVNIVDRGQSEAAYSVGMTSREAFVRIVFPQALLVAMPNLGNLVISSMKETSLAFSLGIFDLVGIGKVIGARTFHFLEIYIDLAIIYFVMCFILEKVFTRIEARLQSRGHKPITNHMEEKWA